MDGDVVRLDLAHGAVAMRNRPTSTIRPGDYVEVIAAERLLPWTLNRRGVVSEITPSGHAAVVLDGSDGRLWYFAQDQLEAAVGA